MFLAAIKPPELIVWINLFAFGGLEAAFLWPTVLGLYWKRANAAGALASMATGIAAYIYFDRVVKRFMGMHIIVPVLLIALIVFVVVSLVTKKPEDRIIERFWGA